MFDLLFYLGKFKTIKPEPQKTTRNHTCKKK